MKSQRRETVVSCALLAGRRCPYCAGKGSRFMACGFLNWYGCDMYAKRITPNARLDRPDGAKETP